MKKLSFIMFGTIIFTAMFFLNACSKQNPSSNDFDFALFEGNSEYGVRTDISQISIQFIGKYDKINFDDFTDMVLTKDGIPIDNSLAYNGKFTYYDKFMPYNDERTRFYFEFQNENREPGIYGFTGKYKGVDFEANKMVVEALPLGNVPANPDDLFSVGCVRTDEYVSDILFDFWEIQQVFDVSDLTNLTLTFNNQEIEFEFEDQVFRYLSVLEDKFETSFCLRFKEHLTMLGVYQLTGNYRGEPFESMEIVIK